MQEFIEILILSDQNIISVLNLSFIFGDSTYMEKVRIFLNIIKTKKYKKYIL